MTLLTVSETATVLGLSQSWVRRHQQDLSVARVGGSLRFDSDLLSAFVKGRVATGKSLEPKEPIMVNRFQRGTVKLRGKKQTWYGRFRMETLDTNGEREIWHKPIGLKTELPTKYAAEKKLREIMDGVLKSGVST